MEPQSDTMPAGHVVRNMKLAMYKLYDKAMPAHVVSMATAKDLVFVGTLHFGCHVYRVTSAGITRMCQLGQQPKLERPRSSRATPTGGCSCYNIVTASEFVAMIKVNETDSSWWLCIYEISSLLKNELEPYSCVEVYGRAPFIVDAQLALLAIGATAWKKSWVSVGQNGKDQEPGDEASVRVLDLVTMETKTVWRVVDNAVSQMKHQCCKAHAMLGVTDTRTGLKVFDLRQPLEEGYVCLYDIPVEEVRTFELAGEFVTVFHKFEYNISLWNMTEQKTILCINVQDQVRQLAEEFCMDEDEENSLLEESDDHVTCVTCIPFENDYLLIYGLKSGCVLGVKVQSRTKIFSIPYPYELVEGKKVKKDTIGIGYLTPGCIATVYEKYGLTVLDFTPESPPDRPPTRGMPK